MILSALRFILFRKITANMAQTASLSSVSGRKKPVHSTALTSSPTVSANSRCNPGKQGNLETGKQGYKETSKEGYKVTCFLVNREAWKQGNKNAGKQGTL